MIRASCTLLALLFLSPANHAQVSITIERNDNQHANSAFRFKHGPSPAKGDLATHAKLLLLDGEPDPNGAELTALIDGILPSGADQPAANFFFAAGTGGGRFRIDLGAAIEIAQVNSYSWHPNTRGPQVYRLWASDGADSRLNPAPEDSIDPGSCGWKLITVVDTRAANGDDGGQYGVSVTGAGGLLGKYRYLLFDCYMTEGDDNWGNTFYSEIDVVASK